MLKKYKEFKKKNNVDVIISNKKYHYVYRITNKKLNKHYYGSRSININPIEDIGVDYFSSSKDVGFIQDQKENPQDYKYKVVRIVFDRREALYLESYLHDTFNVRKNDNFYNRSNQKINGFDFGLGHDGACVKNTVSIKTIELDYMLRINVSDYDINPFIYQNTGKYLYKITDPKGNLNIFINSSLCDHYIVNHMQQGTKFPRNKAWVRDNHGKTIKSKQQRFKHLDGYKCEIVYFKDIEKDYIIKNMNNIYNPFKCIYEDFIFDLKKIQHSKKYGIDRRYRIHIVCNNVSVFVKDFNENIPDFCARLNIKSNIISICNTHKRINISEDIKDCLVIKIPNDLLDEEIDSYIKNHIAKSNFNIIDLF